MPESDEQHTDGPPPPPVRSDWAVFLDVDGTLLEIAAKPGAVIVSRHLKQLLDRLYRRLNGALALISGRTLSDLDQLFSSLELPAAGQHGAERRDSHGQIHRDRGVHARMDRIGRRVREIAAAHPGAELEDKGMTMALHYRHAPEAEAEILSALERYAARAGLELLPGKMVVELKSPLYDKGKAIAAFMNEAAFSGRTAVFAGDDVTDETGFKMINRAGGHSIRVGGGLTQAKWRLDRPEDVLKWLATGTREAHGRCPRMEATGDRTATEGYEHT